LPVQNTGLDKTEIKGKTEILNRLCVLLAILTLYHCSRITTQELYSTNLNKTLLLLLYRKIVQ